MVDMKEKTIEIYFRDLTKEKQREIIENIGDNGNFDVYPIACIPLETDINENENL